MFVSQLAGKTEYCSDQDKRFPQRLRTIRNAPKGLYYRGDIEALDRMRCVAVVGTRNASPHGLEAAYQIGRLAAENDLIVVNGLALGIDAAAIQGALSAGGIAVAVMPCGLDQIVPASNKNLAEKLLASGGCLVSEYPEGTAPQKYSYVQRDRLQSGLSQGVIVIEAAENSGTMHTAGFALKQSCRLACYYSVLLGESSGNRSLIETGRAEELCSDEDISTFLSDLRHETEYQQLSLI